MTFATFKSAVIEGGKRVIKAMQYGLKTADEIAPFGVDSQPLENMTAVYCDTATDGDKVIIGYINLKQEAAAGEFRLYSLKEDKSLAAYVWAKNTGDLELNGKEDFAVRFNALEQALQQQDAAVNAELTKIATGISAAGGSYVPTEIQTDISGAKVETVKLP